MVWAVEGISNGKKVLNYNTRKLGRDGVTSIDLVVKPENLPKAKPELEKLIDRYTYTQGNRYSDFIPGKDKVAEIGLTALIAGGVGAAAVKTGLLTKILLFSAVALKKLWVIVFVGGAAAIKRLFGSNKSKAAASEKGLADSMPTKLPEE